MSDIKEFTKPQDAVFLAYNVLKRLGWGDIDTLEQRIRSQKIQYFAQFFGVAPEYNFNLYLHGPYSPGLAKDLYILRDMDIKIENENFVPEELEERFAKLHTLITGRSTKNLELLATFHWLVNIAKLNPADAKKNLVQLKSISLREAEGIVQEFNKIFAKA
ncbi:hypothetical protein KGO95_01795 [Patescibacteria group bacterium]|nr:hypothetical protein [Patescibacteria group bacterium]